MFDMRAYIVSLIAVFLALAIGILLGTVVVDKGILVEQQKSLLQRIQGQITELRERNSELRKQVAYSNEFASRVLPDVMSNRLVNKKVLLVITPGAPARIKKDLVDTLNSSGANVSVMTVTSNTLQFEDQRVVSQVLAYFPGEELAHKDYLRRVAQELATDLKGEKEFVFANMLNSLNLILLEGNRPSRPEAVVVIGEDAKKADDFQSNFVYSFLENLKDMNIPVVATETENSKLSLVTKYREAGATATVDNIDTVYGKVALIYALNGEAGDFGTKKTADRLLPPL